MKQRYALIGLLIGILIALLAVKASAETCPCTSDWTGLTYTQEQYAQYELDNTVYLWGEEDQPVVISKRDFTLISAIFGVLITGAVIQAILLSFQTS